MADSEWFEKGKAAYDDGQPLHAAPSREDWKEAWLAGWHARHTEAQREADTIVVGIPVRLKKTGGKIRLTLEDGTVIGDQKYLELENDHASLDWTARVTFTGLRLEE